MSILLHMLEILLFHLAAILNLQINMIISVGTFTILDALVYPQFVNNWLLLNKILQLGY